MCHGRNTHTHTRTHTHQHATYTRPPTETLLVAFSEELEAQHTKVAEQTAIVAELTREKEEQIRAHGRTLGELEKAKENCNRQGQNKQHVRDYVCLL